MSVFSTLLTTTQTVITNAAILASAPRVMKRPVFSESHAHATGAGVIVPGRERIRKLHMPDGVWWEYPVYVVLFQAGGSVENLTEIQWMLDTRAALAALLWKARPLAGMATIVDCDYDPHPVFDLGALSKHYDASVQLFTFISVETR